jgi:hypothetical protein
LQQRGVPDEHHRHTPIANPRKVHRVLVEAVVGHHGRAVILRYRQHPLIGIRRGGRLDDLLSAGRHDHARRGRRGGAVCCGERRRLVIWLNPTATPVAIEATDDQFTIEDGSATFSTVEVPAGGQVTVRVLHPGRIDSTAPEHPG